MLVTENKREISFRRSFNLVLPVLSLALIFVANQGYGYERARTNSGQPIYWSDPCISFHVSERGSEDVSFPDFYSVVEQAVSTWSEVDCSFAQASVEGITDSEFVGFVPNETNLNLVLVHEEPQDWPYDRSIIGLTVLHVCAEESGDCKYEGQIIDADIELNGGYFRLSVGDPVARRGFDLLNTLTHEVGHVLGFDHSFVEEATMFEDALPGATDKRDLHEDDIQGLCDVYPIQNQARECPGPEVAGDFFVALDEVQADRTGGGCGVIIQSRGRAFPLVFGVILYFFLRRRD